jgi:Flp pilus assembly pilin Flp
LRNFSATRTARPPSNGLIAALIALAIIAAVGMTGERLITLFESLIPALTR